MLSKAKYIISCGGKFADGRAGNGAAEEGHGGTGGSEAIARGVLLRGHEHVQDRGVLQDIPSVLPEVQPGGRGERETAYPRGTSPGASEAARGTVAGEKTIA